MVMSIRLPSQAGERAVVWEKFDAEAGGPTRIVMTSDGNGRWMMATEAAYQSDDPDDPDGEVWSDGDMYLWDGPAGLHPNDLGQATLDLAIAIRRASNAPRSEVDPLTPTFEKHGVNIIAKNADTRCLLVTNHGYDTYGVPLLELYTNKPMDAGEWLSSLYNLSKAIGTWERERGEL